MYRRSIYEVCIERYIHKEREGGRERHKGRREKVRAKRLDYALPACSRYQETFGSEYDLARAQLRNPV